MFSFFLQSYRKGILTFCGSEVDVKFDIKGDSGKKVFMDFDNGKYKEKSMISRHRNILRGVIIGKKSWGLWVKEWTDGIREGLFLKEEILNEFSSRGIKIPTPLLTEFYNRIYR